MKKKFYYFLGLIVLLSACTVRYENLRRIDVTKYLIDTTYHSADPALESLLLPYKTKLDGEMYQVVGYNDTLMEKGMPEGSLGNFASDVLLYSAERYLGKKVDVSIINAGGLRLPYLSAGPITKGKIFELNPFENELVIMEIKGSVLQKLVDKSIEKGGWPVSKGLNIEIDAFKQKNVVKLHSQPIDSMGIYLLATNDYLANGGDLCDFLRTEKRTNTGKIIRELFFEYLVEHDTIHFVKEGRVKYVQ